MMITEVPFKGIQNVPIEAKQREFFPNVGFITIARGNTRRFNLAARLIATQTKMTIQY